MTAIKNYRARHIQKAIRAQLTYRGAERVIIHRDGRVSAYGVMPGSIVTGWWFAGYDKEIIAEIHRAVALQDQA